METDRTHEPDWKEIARQAISRGIAFPHDEPMALFRYSVVRHPSWPVERVASQKGIRGFLWRHRRSRQLLRARGVVWKRAAPGGMVEVGLGAWTAPDVPAVAGGRLLTVEID